MITIRTVRTWLSIAVVALLLGGCATTPQPNATLEEARDHVGAISSDPQINRLAGAELGEARAHLEAAEQLWRDREDANEVSHRARLAMRQADIAQEATLARQSDRRVDQLSSERERLRLQAQAARAERAAAHDRIERARAEGQARQADVERREAEEARQLAEQRAERLQQQLAELEARPTERGLVLTLGSDVLFDFDRAEVKPGAQRTLERIGDFLNEYPERQVLIEGFTDSVGSREYNMQLSEQRARAVRDTLTNLGVNPQRIQIRGFGPDHPVASNNNEAGRQLNRRVEVIISDDEEAVPERS